MALTLLSKSGKILAKEEEPTVFRLTAADKEKIKVVWGGQRLQDFLNRRRGGTGYIPKSAFDALNVTTVPIPANFAGLEAVAVPTRLQEQLFRIYEVEENEDYVTVRARHVWYDNLQNYTLWKPTEDTSYTAAAVCRNILTNAISPVESDVASDCTDTKKGSEFDYERKNLVECFLDPEKGVCAKFGLSMIRDNWDFYCLKDVGYDRGYLIQDKKNLLGVVRTESIEHVATRVCPIGMDNKGDIVWLNNNGNKWVDSSHINDYSYPRVEIFDTGLQIGQNGVTAQNINQKLLEAGQKRFSDDKVDIPEITMTIDFLSIGDTEEYAQYKGLDKVYLYDIVTIKDTVRGYEYSAQVVGVEHDILTGMLTSVTLGKIQDSDGVRKIAIWQVPEVSGDNIRLHSIIAGSFEPGAIQGDDIAEGGVQWVHIDAASIDELTTQQLDALKANIHTLIAGSITADDITAGSITADKIDTTDLTVDFANIMDATIESLIAHDAITDKYFIDKLMVRQAQMVYATIGELVIKASNGQYYRLDVDEYGAVTPVLVTPTASEIAAGVTSDGHASIIETDLLVSDLSASNLKAINALIDKITADQINVDKLFARQATINALNATDIRGNQYLQLMVAGYSTTYTQWNDPATEQGSTVQDGDIWFKTAPSHTHQQMASYTHTQLAQYTYGALEGSQQYLRKNGEWVLCIDPVEVDHTVSSVKMTTDSIAITVANNTGDIASIKTLLNSISLSVADKYDRVSGIDITSLGVDISGSQYVKIASGGYFQVTTGNFSIDTNSSTYVLWSGASTAANSSFWLKKSGEIYAVSGTLGGWTLAANSMSSGTGSSYMNINSNPSNTYAMWAGEEAVANAPFRLKRDGTLYITKLIALNKNNTETTVNLYNAGLWKLSGETITSVVGGVVTLSDGTTFNSAGSVDVSSTSSGSVYDLAYYSGQISGDMDITVNLSNGVTETFTETIYFNDRAGSGLAYDAGMRYADGLYTHLGSRELGYMDHGNFESVGTHDWYYK